MGIASTIEKYHVGHGLQGLSALLTLGFLAHVASWYNSNAIHVPNEVAFAIFVSVFTLLIILPYRILTPNFFPKLMGGYTNHSILVVEALSMILWFAAFVSVAAFVGKLQTCEGDVCHCAKAGVAVAAISWVIWGVTSLFVLRFMIGQGGSDEKGIRKGERLREKGLRALRLHSVWTGHGKGEKDMGSTRTDYV